MSKKGERYVPYLPNIYEETVEDTSTRQGEYHFTNRRALLKLMQVKPQEAYRGLRERASKLPTHTAYFGETGKGALLVQSVDSSYIGATDTRKRLPVEVSLAKDSISLSLGLDSQSMAAFITYCQSVNNSCINLASEHPLEKASLTTEQDKAEITLKIGKNEHGQPTVITTAAYRTVDKFLKVEQSPDYLVPSEISAAIFASLEPRELPPHTNIPKKSARPYNRKPGYSLYGSPPTWEKLSDSMKNFLASPTRVQRDTRENVSTLSTRERQIQRAQEGQKRKGR